jgi:hypothetical protein
MSSSATPGFVPLRVDNASSAEVTAFVWKPSRENKEERT